MTHKVFKSSIVVMVSFFFINSAANVSIKNADSIYTLANPIFHFAAENKQIKIKGKNSYLNQDLNHIIQNPEVHIKALNSLIDINSLEAKYNKRLKIIEFQDSVKLVASADDDDMKLETEELSLDLDNENITSTSKVFASLNNLTVNSIGIDLMQQEEGFEAKFHKGNFQLDYQGSVHKGYADEIVILLKTNKLIMKGEAYFNQDGFIIESDLLHYDLEENKIIKSINSKIQNST